MDKYICDCCGGKINPQTMKCEFCGTQYKRDYDDNVFRIETYTNPVRTFAAEVLVNGEDIHAFGAERMSEFALKTLVRKLSDCLSSSMVVDSEYDYTLNQHRVRGTIKMVQPVNHVEDWKFGR
jgi:hypothetical protein